MLGGSTFSGFNKTGAFVTELFEGGKVDMQTTTESCTGELRLLRYSSRNWVRQIYSETVF